jgi:deazaflavin-dependent oxidoreductase (nitroreductase family)
LSTRIPPASAEEVTRVAAVREAAAKHASKHTRLIRSAKAGRILSALMLPLFLIRPPSEYGVITTIGRKTGKKRRRCIRVIRRDNKAYTVQLRPPALAMINPGVVAGWVWNIRANPSVTARIRGGTFRGIAREPKDRAEFEQAREAICETVTLFDYGECVVHLHGLPTRSKVKELHRYWFDTGIPLVIELCD